MDIYLVFSKTGTWLSRALAMFTHDKYVHTSLSFDDKLTQMYSFGRLYAKNPFFGGFVVENIQQGVYQLNHNNEIKVYRFTVTVQQYQELQHFVNEFLKKAKYYHYNFLGLIALRLRIKFIRKNHYFCSQFVSELFIKVGILNESIKPEFTSPNDLIAAMELEKVYEGFVFKYPSVLQANLEKAQKPTN